MLHPDRHVSIIASTSPHRIDAFTSGLREMYGPGHEVRAMTIEVDEDRVKEELLDEGIVPDHELFPLAIALRKAVGQATIMKDRLVDIPPGGYALYTGDSVQGVHMEDGLKKTVEKPPTLENFFELGMSQSGREVTIQAAIAVVLLRRARDNGHLEMISPGLGLLQSHYRFQAFDEQKLVELWQHKGADVLTKAGGVSFQYDGFADTNIPLSWRVIDPSTRAVVGEGVIGWTTLEPMTERNKIIYGAKQEVLQIAMEKARANAEGNMLYEYTGNPQTRARVEQVIYRQNRV